MVISSLLPRACRSCVPRFHKQATSRASDRHRLSFSAPRLFRTTHDINTPYPATCPSPPLFISSLSGLQSRTREYITVKARIGEEEFILRANRRDEKRCTVSWNGAEKDHIRFFNKFVGLLDPPLRNFNLTWPHGKLGPEGGRKFKEAKVIVTFE